jgi:ABC-type glutathione transport system ATPase component
MTDAPLVEIDDLVIEYGTSTPPALDRVSLRIDAGSTLGLVGESGSGKSSLARTLIGSLFLHGGRATGRIRFDDVDVLTASARDRRALQGRRIGYVPQNSLGALNPVVRVGAQIAECFRIHEGLGRRAAGERAVELLDRVGIAEPARRARDYPHQLSGGMRQRVTIAIAIALDPDLLVADEPTTALDATIQAQMVELLDDLQRERGMAILLISHDLGVIAELADNVTVLRAGRVVEQAGAEAFFAGPTHPYSAALLAATPRLASHG